MPSNLTKYVSDRLSAEEAIDAANTTLVAVLVARQEYPDDTPENANRLRDLVRDMQRSLSLAETMLSRRGEQ